MTASWLALHMYSNVAHGLQRAMQPSGCDSSQLSIMNASVPRRFRVAGAEVPMVSVRGSRIISQSTADPGHEQHPHSTHRRSAYRHRMTTCSSDRHSQTERLCIMCNGRKWYSFSSLSRNRVAPHGRGPASCCRSSTSPSCSALLSLRGIPVQRSFPVRLIRVRLLTGPGQAMVQETAQTQTSGPSLQPSDAPALPYLV